MSSNKYMEAGRNSVSEENSTIKKPSDHALGIEIDNGICLHLVDKNMPLPVSVSRMFSPVSVGQKKIEIHIVQGKSIKASENRSLSRFVFTDLSASGSAPPLIKIGFQMNSQGMFRVCVKNSASGYEKKMIISKNPFLIKYQPYMELYKLKNKADKTMILAESLKTHLKKNFLYEIREISANVQKAAEERNFSRFSELYVSLDVIYCELSVMAEFKAGSYAE